MEYWDQTMGPHERVVLRELAVHAVSKGEKKLHVARRFGITRQTLHNWVLKHRRGGAAALAARPRGRSRRQVLEPWQEAQVAGAISRPPWTVNSRYTRWTKRAIAEYIEQSFGVPFNAWQVDSHLHRWGFESHKEVRRAFMNTQDRVGVPSRSLQAPAEATV
ncbi:MAG: helix-turn-helix domain-containing protein [Candidatus Methylomirabilia bacterium]